jgi:hypothetical protein
MRSRKILLPIIVGGLFTAALVVAPAGAAPALSGSSFTRQIPSGGTTSFSTIAPGVDGAIQDPEFAGEEDGEEGPEAYDGTIVDRSHSGGTGHGASITSGKKAKSNPELKTSFNGLNFRDQRLANGGNQFSVEPPDQALCVGNGQVVEAVNDVLNVYNQSGSSLLPSNPAVHNAVDLNSFFGYIPAINRTTGIRGPFVTDPVCHFDPATQRFFVAVLTLESTPGGAFTGVNHIDIAVSNSSNATGFWTIYRIAVQNDGTQGTPNHGCSGGPCIGDYPHMGADANGIYITTNEYSFFGPEFKSANIYAISKSQLAATPASITVTQMETVGADNGNPGFTVWPAISPGNAYEFGAGGTEYFLSSNAAEEANGSGSSTDLLVWALTNTSSLNSASPALSLSHAKLNVNQYGIPPKSDQKPGDFPQGQCINDTTTTVTSLGPAFVGCWRALFGAEPAHNEVISHLDSNDTRMQQVSFANGKLWGALDTALTINSQNKAGVAWYIVKPSVASGSVTASLAKQGYLGLANNNVTYPAIGVTASGRGVMAFTLVGADHHPSAGYSAIDANVGVGDIHIAAEGVGVDDGFTSYKAQVGNPPRTRWGDYGAAAVDGNSIWIASEYIAQSCSLAEYVAAPFGSCGGTRATLGNWATRISKVTP